MKERVWYEFKLNLKDYRIVQYFGQHYEGQVHNIKYGWITVKYGHSMESVKKELYKMEGVRHG